MPVLSVFYGIIIRMFFIDKENNPPHVHIVYGDYAACISIQNGLILSGDVPSKAYHLVIEWMELYKNELLNI